MTKFAAATERITHGAAMEIFHYFLVGVRKLKVNEQKRRVVDGNWLKLVSVIWTRTILSSCCQFTR